MKDKKLSKQHKQKETNVPQFNVWHTTGELKQSCFPRIMQHDDTFVDFAR